MSATDHRKLDGAVAGGLAWTAGAKSTTQAITWLSTLIAARLLTRADFGLVNMAGLFGNLTVMLAEFGLGTAVLQMPELSEDVVAQVNTASVLIGALTYGLAVLAAPLVALFFKADQLRLLVIVNSIGLLIMGFQSVPMAMLEKELDYRKVSLVEATQAAVMAVVTVGFALAGFAYWSLVAGPIVGRFGAAILTCWWARPRFRWPRFAEVRAPLRLGIHVAVSRLASAVYLLSDGVIVGRMLGEAALGTYQLALQIASAPADKIGLLIMRVTGPLFARVQKELESVRRYLKIVSEGLALSSFPLLFGLTIVAPEAVRVVLGPEWVSAAGPIRWLALFAGLRSMSTLMTQVLTSQRYTKFAMWVSLMGFGLMPVAFLIAARWGTTAVAATWILLSPVTILPLILKTLRVIKLPSWEYLEALSPAAMGTAAMAAVLLAWRLSGESTHFSPFWNLAMEILAGGGVYAGVLLLFYRDRLNRYVRLIRDLRRGDPEFVTSESQL